MNKRSKPKDYKTVAKQIADLMANPDTPTTVVDNMADILTDMSSYLDWHTPEMIEKSLIAYDQQYKSRKPKVPRDDAGYVIFQEREQ